MRSHWQDVLIESLEPPPSPPLELYLRNEKLMLASPDAIYSLEDDYLSYAEALRRLPADFVPASLLVLGFGLGSIPIIMDRKRKQRPRITGIELDPRIVDLANRYLPADLLSRIELICADALEWVHQHKATYDLIAVDLFIDTIVPSGCSLPEFQIRLREILNPGGILLFSRLNMENKQERTAFDRMVRQQFPGLQQFEVGGNTIYQWQAA